MSTHKHNTYVKGAEE